MMCVSKRLLAAAFAATVVAAPAMAQPFYGYDDDRPPPFRHGPGWDGPPRWDRWHHRRRWGDEGFDRRGGRDGDRRDGRDRFGNGDRGRFGGGDGGGRPRAEDARQQGGDSGGRRGGPDRNVPRQFGNDSD